MVRDAYSAGGQPQQAESGVASQPLDLRGNTANLTQELSQLLAASIAQGQASKRAPNGATAGSELANLAALVSASQNQRGQQPSFRDGLSSLSYSRPANTAPPPPAPVQAHSAGGLLVSEPHDEEPMPIPSTWRQPMSNDDDRWYRQQLGAAALGLIAGLIVVVPAVLWLSGWLGGPQTKAVAARHQAAPEPAPVKVAPAPVAAPVKVAEVKQVKVHIASPAEPLRVRAAPPPVVEQPPAPVRPAAPRVEPARSRADDSLAQAKRLIENGNIPAARAVLSGAEAERSAPVTFMLAETFDPNMLASWQTRGIMANPERARALYLKARDLGDGRAQQRLDWLTAK